MGTSKAELNKVKKFLISQEHYIPIVSGEGKVIFTPEDFDALRSGGGPKQRKPSEVDAFDAD
jgi:hypothetical protein